MQYLRKLKRKIHTNSRYVIYINVVGLGLLLLFFGLIFYYNLEGVGQKIVENNKYSTLQLKRVDQKLGNLLAIESILSNQLLLLKDFTASFYQMVSDPDSERNTDQYLSVSEQVLALQGQLEELWPPELPNEIVRDLGEDVLIISGIIEDAQAASAGELLYLYKETNSILKEINREFKEIYEQISLEATKEREFSIQSINKIIAASNEAEIVVKAINYKILVFFVVLFLLIMTYYYITSSRLNNAAVRAIALQEKALSASRIKTQFIASMSHELRTPLNATIGFAEILNTEPLTSSQQDYVSRILISSKSLLTIINDILDLTKIESGKLELSPTVFSIQELLEEQLILFSKAVGEKGIELCVNIGDGIPEKLKGDADKLSQVLTNIIGNAVKFTHQGEIEIGVNILAQDGAKIVLNCYVRDTGIGIPKDKQNLLFTAFSQVDSSITRNYGGTGLGLAISQRIVQLMGGVIKVVSQPGFGSTFSFSINLDMVESDEKNTFQTVPLIDKRKSTSIVLGYKNAIVLKILGEQLERLGCKVTLVSSLLAVKQSLLNYSADILLLDTALFDECTVDTVNAFQLEVNKKIVIVLISPLLRGNIDFLKNKLGVDSIITKPVRPSDLLKLSGRCSIVPGNSSQDDDLNTESSLSKYRVLVTDDVEMNRILAGKILSKLGATVDFAENGLAAIDAAKKQFYDVIFMDLNMPVMDGLTATKQIRAESMCKGSVIIALTACALVESRDFCINSGMNDILIKPFTLKSFKRMLTKWLALNESSLVDNKFKEGESVLVSNARSTEVNSELL